MPKPTTLQCNHGQWTPIVTAALHEVVEASSEYFRFTTRDRLLIELGAAAALHQVMKEATAQPNPISLAE